MNSSSFQNKPFLEIWRAVYLYPIKLIASLNNEPTSLIISLIYSIVATKNSSFSPNSTQLISTSVQKPFAFPTSHRHHLSERVEETGGMLFSFDSSLKKSLLKSLIVCLFCLNKSLFPNNHSIKHICMYRLTTPT